MNGGKRFQMIQTGDPLGGGGHAGPVCRKGIPVCSDLICISLADPDKMDIIQGRSSFPAG